MTKNSWKASLSCTAYLSPFLVIGIPSLSVVSGNNSSRCQAPNYNLFLHIIPKWTTRLKLSISMLSNTFVVLFINGKGSGVITYHGLSIYKTTFHISTGMTHFQALYDRLLPSISIYTASFSLVHEVDRQLLSRDDLL